MKTPKLENQSNIKSNDIKNALKGVIKFSSENPKLQNKLFNEEIPLFLQINSFKIPKAQGPVKQVFRIPLTHCPRPSDADICLIVPDVKGIPNKEHERHLEHYETLLKSKDVTGIKKIMTFHEFRTEYETFELKNRLVDLYDIFLVDGRISGKVVHKCGSIFYKKRKIPVAVKLHLPKLKSHIEQSIKKAFFQFNLKSDSHSVQIGHSKMKTNHLIENVYSVVEFINKQFPGNMDNIRSLNVYAYRGSSIPIYISLKNPNDIKVPILTSKKPKAYKSFSGELSTQFNADVVVQPSGHVIVKRKSKHLTEQNGQHEDDNITDAEIIRENKKIDQIEGQNNDDNKTNKGKKRKKSELEDMIECDIKEECSSFNTIGGKKKKTASKNNLQKDTKGTPEGKYVRVKKEENKQGGKKVKLEYGEKGNKKKRNKARTFGKLGSTVVEKSKNKKKYLAN